MHQIRRILNTSEHVPTCCFPFNTCTRLAMLGAATVALFSGTAFAQSVPENNNCANATRIFIGSPVTVNGTTVNATNDGGTACGAFSTSPDVWYVFSPRGSTGPVTIDTCGSAFDTVLSVHSGCPGTVANTLACNDNAFTGDCAGSPTSSLTFNAVNGINYFIRVCGSQNASGPFVLRARHGSPVVSPPPNNDACSGARIVGYGTHSYTTLGTVADGPGGPTNECINSIREDVWFRYTACISGEVIFQTCFDAPWDTMIGVYGGDCAALSPIACNDNECGLQSFVRLNATAGTSYLIRVGVSPGALFHGAGALRIVGPACPPPPPPPPGPANNNCSAAINMGQLSAGGGIVSVNGTTVDATNDGAASCGSSSTSPDVWYRFLARGTGSITIDTCGSTFDTVLSAHTSCPGTVGNVVACNDDAAVGGCAGTPTSSITFTMTSGVTYWIRVAGFRGRTGTFTLRFNSSPDGDGEQPSNDLCSNAQWVGYGIHAYNTIGALTDGPAGVAGDCTHEMRNDVWFRFAACTTGVVTAGTCTGTIWDSMISVYTGSCSTPNLITCNNDGCGVQSRVSFNVVAGTSYLIRVGVNPTSPYRGAGVLSISGPACPPPGPVNNACSNATYLGNFGSGSHSTTITGTTVNATNDGSTSCGSSNASPDVWYRFSTGNAGLVTIETCGSGLDTVLSVHSACGGTAANTLACNDNNAGAGPCPGGTSSFLVHNAATHGHYYLRVAGNNNASGPFTMRVSYVMGLTGGPQTCPCDWNYDRSLTATDFYAFLNDFLSGAADFNYSGEVDSQDLFDYLNCFMTSPGLCAD